MKTPDKQEGMLDMSVVIAVYNRETLIERTLDSIFRQTWPKLHIIVVDNGSTDRTVEVVEGWRERNCTEGCGRRLTLMHEPRPGAAGARRRGVESVYSTYVMFFDSDDVMCPETVENAMREFERDPQTDVVAWPVRIHFLDGTSRITRVPRGNIAEGHIVHCYLSTQSYAIRKDVLLRAGNWNPDMASWNDWELGVRILLQNPKVVGLKTVGAEVYRQKESITGESFSRQAGVWEKSLESARKNIEQSDVKNKERLLRLINYRKIILAALYDREGAGKQAESLRHEALRDAAVIRYVSLLKFIYRYTYKGGRGAYTLFRPFL